MLRVNRESSNGVPSSEFMTLGTSLSACTSQMRTVLSQLPAQIAFQELDRGENSSADMVSFGGLGSS